MERNRTHVGLLLTLLALAALSRASASELEGSFLSQSAGDALTAPSGGACEKGCPDDCGLACNMCPCAYGMVEGLVMWRTRGFANQPIAINNSTGQTALATSDLKAGAAGGMRALLGFQVCCVPVEVGYFGLFDQVATASISDASPNPFSFPDGLGQASDVFVGANQIDVRYSTQLHSGEVNLPCCNCCCDCDDRCRSVEWLLGFRYINLREELDILGTRIVSALPENGQYNIRTSNDLYGAQIGTRLRRCFGQWSWEATGKVGIFGNNARQTQFVNDFPPNTIPPLRATIGANDSHVAFMGELGLTAIYQLNETWGVRAGYNLMYIDGLALAPNQLDFSFSSTSGGTINTGGHLLLQGASLGLEARF